MTEEMQIHDFLKEFKNEESKLGNSSILINELSKSESQNDRRESNQNSRILSESTELKSESGKNQTTNNNEWQIGYSDDESELFDPKENYREINGKRVWEPKGSEIAALYFQLEKRGYLDLKWQCPGRRAPSIPTLPVNEDKKQEIPEAGEKQNQSHEFDFEDDFGLETAPTAKLNQSRRRSNQGPQKRSQANLNKVMQNIRKYQYIDQQQRKMATPVVATTISATTTTSEMISTTASASASTAADSKSNIAANYDFN